MRLTFTAPHSARTSGLPCVAGDGASRSTSVRRAKSAAGATRISRNSLLPRETDSTRPIGTPRG